MPGAPFVVSLLLVVRPGAPNSFIVPIVIRPGAASSVVVEWYLVFLHLGVGLVSQKAWFPSGFQVRRKFRCRLPKWVGFADRVSSPLSSFGKAEYSA